MQVLAVLPTLSEGSARVTDADTRDNILACCKRCRCLPSRLQLLDSAEGELHRLAVRWKPLLCSVIERPLKASSC